jgi:WXG100 family type VII secretion target
MNITEIEINTDMLADDINSMEQNVVQLEAEYNHMFQQLQELNGMWSGPANSAFAVQFAGDLEAFKELTVTLQEIISGLKDAKQEYDSCEQRVSGIINTIRI